jgi:hypothetical protein
MEHLRALWGWRLDFNSGVKIILFKKCNTQQTGEQACKVTIVLLDYKHMR